MFRLYSKGSEKPLEVLEQGISVVLEEHRLEQEWQQTEMFFPHKHEIGKVEILRGFEMGRR